MDTPFQFTEVCVCGVCVCVCERERERERENMEEVERVGSRKEARQFDKKG